MSAQNFLEIVNDVLRRLREDEVVSTNSTDYSKLIGGFVNDAAQEVSDAHDWSTQYLNLDITTVSGTQKYDLRYDNVNILSVINDTKNTRLHQVTQQFINDHIRLRDSAQTGDPYYWAPTFYLGTKSNTGIWLYPEPDSSGDTITVWMKFPEQAWKLDGTNDSSGYYIPTNPIVLLAYARAVSERGEDGGISYAEADDIARRSLSDHIAMDAAKQHWTRTTWQVI